MLEINNVHASVSGETFLDDINFKAEPGRIYILMGRTGSGKTSLMRAVAGLLPLDSGSLIYDGVDMTNTPVWQRDTALVYQQFINYPNKTVRANVELPLKKIGLRGAELNERVERYLSKVGMLDFQNRRPSQLSGGQQQRLALARSLARETKILMLDEPLMNLDFKLREQLREEFLELFSGVREAITLYATTEIAEAMMLGYEVLVMHEGRVLQSGTPAEVYDRPMNIMVAQIVNDPPMTVLSGRLQGDEVVLTSGAVLERPAHLSTLAEGDYQFGIRANDLLPTSSGTSAESCVIEFVEVTGSVTVLYATSSSGEMVMQVDGIHDYSIGAKLDLSVRTDRLFVFDDAGDLVIAPETGDE